MPSDRAYKDTGRRAGAPGMGDAVESRTITMFGAGYVGLVSAACLADSGHRVTVVDVDRSKLEALDRGELPFHEPSLGDVVGRTRNAGRLGFAHPDRLPGYGEFVYVAVGTPSSAGGAADLRAVNAVIDRVASEASRDAVVVMKSTVPPGTGAALSERLAPAGIPYVSNPEFLREGSAIQDWFHTDRIVLGGPLDAVTRVAALYDGIDAPVVVCDVASAELVKYASNAFLATKISFANEIARLCRSVGADATTVMDGVGLDPRIGPAFLNAGIGYGGSCFPKDTRALDFLASLNGHDLHLLKAVIDVNSRQRLLPIIALRKALGSLCHADVAVLGLTFKPDTDDVRESPAADIVEMLLAEGATVRSFDPVGHLALSEPGYRQEDGLAEAMSGASAAIVTTEWAQIRDADWERLIPSMKPPKVVFDGRNCLDRDAVAAAGGTYLGVGRA